MSKSLRLWKLILFTMVNMCLVVGQVAAQDISTKDFLSSELFEPLAIENGGDEIAYPDLLFQEAVLHGLFSRHWKLRAGGRPEGTERPISLEEVKRYEEAAKGSLLSAVKSFKKITDDINFFNYKKMDEVLFAYAVTLETAGYHKESRRVWHRLIKDFPESTRIGIAYAFFADYYFSQSSFANAERFYDKVMAMPPAMMHDYAAYKRAMIREKLGQKENAVKDLKQLYTKLSARSDPNSLRVLKAVKAGLEKVVATP